MRTVLSDTLVILQNIARQTGKSTLIKAPEVHLIDTGLATHLTGHSSLHLTHDTTLLRNLLGTFVIMELRKQLTWSTVRAKIFRFRTLAGKEVDVVLEDPRGRLVSIEVKSAASVTKNDFSELEIFAEETGKKFLRGVVLYTDDTAVAFSDKLTALPMGYKRVASPFILLLKIFWIGNICRINRQKVCARRGSVYRRYGSGIWRQPQLVTGQSVVADDITALTRAMR